MLDVVGFDTKIDRPMPSSLKPWTIPIYIYNSTWASALKTQIIVAYNNIFYVFQNEYLFAIYFLKFK